MKDKYELEIKTKTKKYKLLLDSIEEVIKEINNIKDSTEKIELKRRCNNDK